ncbi:hypothetical protein V5F63_13060 [Xanthobacter autotrophicus DSM 597]|uniref:DUF6867 family protein n=1 Tax=Xanthobacter TaxID=279 RepID=UPI001D7D44A7|nr:hypothetical protein [Xanthobacter flavus]MBP2152057.1 hypothetical protein [Xanthobacter flavus]
MSAIHAARDPGRATSPMLIGPAIALVVLVATLFVWPKELIGASLGDFLLVTLFLGGGAAWLTGKAVARSWDPYLALVAYCALLACAVRFCHFALFQATLFDLEPLLVEFVLLASIATLGFRAMRQRQMTVQYGWMYEREGHMAWRPRRGVDGAST